MSSGEKGNARSAREKEKTRSRSRRRTRREEERVSRAAAAATRSARRVERARTEKEEEDFFFDILIYLLAVVSHVVEHLLRCLGRILPKSGRLTRDRLLDCNVRKTPSGSRIDAVGRGVRALIGKRVATKTRLATAIDSSSALDGFVVVHSMRSSD